MRVPVVAAPIFMKTLSRSAALGALFLGSFLARDAVVWALPANATGGANSWEIAEFGTIEIDDSAAPLLTRFIERSYLIKRIKIASAKNTLDYRPNAPGVYRVTFVSQGTSQRGGVRITVAIVGQNRLREARAFGQDTQTWGGYIWQEPLPDYVNPYLNPLRAPGGQEDVRAYPYPLPRLPGPARGNGCRDRREKVGGGSADDDDKKKADKPEKSKAPDPAPEKSPKRDSPPTREEKTREEKTHQPERASRSDDDNQPERRPRYNSVPKPMPKRDDSKRDDAPKRDNAPDPAPRAEKRPTADRYPNPSPLAGTDNVPATSSAPDPLPNVRPNRPPTYTGNGPNPLPDFDAGRGRGNPNRPLPDSRPTWNPSPYGTTYPPYGAPYPPYVPPYFPPYGAAYPSYGAAYDVPGAKNWNSVDEATVRVAVERALENARNQAESDFARQIRGA